MNSLRLFSLHKLIRLSHIASDAMIESICYEFCLLLFVMLLNLITIDGTFVNNLLLIKVRFDLAINVSCFHRAFRLRMR